MRNPFSPYDYNEQTPGKLSLESSRTYDDMYNDVVVNEGYVADARKSFMTNDYENQYVTQVTHAYVYRNMLQPNQHNNDKPIPEPVYAFGPQPNEIWYNTTDNNLLYKAPDRPWETEDRVLDENNNTLSLLNNTYYETRYKTFNGKIFNGVLKFSGNIAKLNGGVLAKVSNLSEIYLPGHLVLGDGLLQECKNLTSVIMGESTKTIQYGVLRSCLKLEELYIMNDLAGADNLSVYKRSSVGNFHDAQNPKGTEQDPQLNYTLYVPITSTGVVGDNTQAYRELKGTQYPEDSEYIWKDDGYIPIIEYSIE